ncbi:hypothetical protein NECAME_17976, partial [Necator americanus]
ASTEYGQPPEPPDELPRPLPKELSPPPKELPRPPPKELSPPPKELPRPLPKELSPPSPNDGRLGLRVVVLSGMM